MFEGFFAITRVVTAIITGVLGPFFIWWLKEKYSNEDETVGNSEKEQQRTLNEEIQFAQNISAELESVRKGLEADRCWIAQFHNGGKFLNSVRDASMKKLSVTHEITAPGVSKEQRTFSDVLVSFFSGMIGNLIKNEHVKYTGDQVDVDPEVKLLFRQRGTEEMHLFAMRNIDGVLIGMLCIDYTTKERGISEEERQYLITKASLLAGYVFYGKVERENREDI